MTIFKESYKEELDGVRSKRLEIAKEKKGDSFQVLKNYLEVLLVLLEESEDGRISIRKDWTGELRVENNNDIIFSFTGPYDSADQFFELCKECGFEVKEEKLKSGGNIGDDNTFYKVSIGSPEEK